MDATRTFNHLSSHAARPTVLIWEVVVTTLGSSNDHHSRRETAWLGPGSCSFTMVEPDEDYADDDYDEDYADDEYQADEDDVDAVTKIQARVRGQRDRKKTAAMAPACCRRSRCFSFIKAKIRNIYLV